MDDLQREQQDKDIAVVKSQMEALKASQHGRYLRLNGTRTTKIDVQRLIWYAAGCGYWTDNWNKLNLNGIPCCPKCGCPGFQIVAKDWDEGAAKQSDNYRKQLAGKFEICERKLLDASMKIVGDNTAVELLRELILEERKDGTH